MAYRYLHDRLRWRPASGSKRYRITLAAITGTNKYRARRKRKEEREKKKEIECITNGEMAV